MDRAINKRKNKKRNSRAPVIDKSSKTRLSHRHPLPRAIMTSGMIWIYLHRKAKQDASSTLPMKVTQAMSHFPRWRPVKSKGKPNSWSRITLPRKRLLKQRENPTLMKMHCLLISPKKLPSGLVRSLTRQLKAKQKNGSIVRINQLARKRKNERSTN